MLDELRYKSRSVRKTYMEKQKRIVNFLLFPFTI